MTVPAPTSGNAGLDHMHDSDGSSHARGRNRAKTKEALQLAILRIKNKGAKLSIRAVAMEAGVDPSLIHNTYPDVAEEIRAILGRNTRRQRDEKHDALMETRRLLRSVTAERDQLKKEMADLASVNLALVQAVAELKAELDGRLKRIGRDPLVRPAPG